jgi:protein-S-isoprenylcysteine O-methyltransferase Ste14
MRASAIEFRLRVAIIAVIITLGFWAPWIGALGIGRRTSLLEWLALEISRLGIAPFSVATPSVIVVGTLIATLGATLRIWGTAYLGMFTMKHAQMLAGSVMADGPYRYLRNPLYLGSWCSFGAMALIMPASGAFFAIVLLTLFFLRLILGEEAFLSGQIGEPYLAYLRTVPRLIPRLIPRLRNPLKPSGRKPRWLQSVLAEIFPIGVVVTLAFFSRSYSNMLMSRVIIISFGLSLLVPALLPNHRNEAQATE